MLILLLCVDIAMESSVDFDLIAFIQKHGGPAGRRILREVPLHQLRRANDDDIECYLRGLLWTMQMYLRCVCDCIVSTLACIYMHVQWRSKAPMRFIGPCSLGIIVLVFLLMCSSFMETYHRQLGNLYVNGCMCVILFGLVSPSSFLILVCIMDGCSGACPDYSYHYSTLRPFVSASDILHYLDRHSASARDRHATSTENDPRDSVEGGQGGTNGGVKGATDLAKDQQTVDTRIAQTKASIDNDDDVSKRISARTYAYLLQGYHRAQARLREDICVELTPDAHICQKLDARLRAKPHQQRHDKHTPKEHFVEYVPSLLVAFSCAFMPVTIFVLDVSS